MKSAMPNEVPEPLLELALAASDGRGIDWPSALATLGEEDREAAAVLAELVRLFEIGAEGRASDATALGDRWGPFELEARLGSGSFGEVFRARDSRLDRAVAVKVFRADDERTRGEVFREGRLLARVHHPNVAAVHGVEEHDRRAGLVMELVAGETLAELITRRGPLSAREAALVGVDLCRALAALHHARVLHRDVKPENVLREAGGRIVLVDLGVGLELGELETLRQVAGTPLYLAPELLAGELPSPRSDLYAVGVLLFFLVSGRHPAEAASIEELRAVHRERRYLTLRDARPDVPWSFAQLVAACLAPEPSQRPRSAGELEARLAEILDPARSRPPRRWSQRRRLGLPLTAGLVVLVALVSLWQLRRSAGSARAETAAVVLGEIAGGAGAQQAQNDVAIALSREPGLEVMTRARLLEALERMRLGPETAIRGAVGLELCRREGFTWLLEGALSEGPTGEGLAVEARSCADGTLVISRRQSPREIGRELASRQPPAIEPLAQVTTPSIAALELYTRAVGLEREGKPAEACTLLETALTRDPDFAMAFAELAICRNGLGELAGALEAAEAAYERRHQVSERERLRIEQMYHYDRLQYHQALEPARRLAVLYPDDAEALRQLSHLYERVGRLPDAIDKIQAARKVAPSVLHDGLLAGLLVEVGRGGEALEVITAARARSEQEPYLDWVEGWALLAQGDFDAAHERFLRLAGFGGGYSEAAGHLMALNKALAGRLVQAQRQLLENATRSGNTPYWSLRDRRIAARLALLGNDREALAQALRPFEELPVFPASLRDFRAAAELWAEAAEVERVEALLARLTELDAAYPSEISRGSRLEIEAELARLAGDFERARERLAEARRAWPDAAMLLTARRLVLAGGRHGEARELAELIVGRQGELLELGYGLEWRLVRDEITADLGNSATKTVY